MQQRIKTKSVQKMVRKLDAYTEQSQETKTLERYTEELFYNSEENSAMRKNIDGPNILQPITLSAGCMPKGNRARSIRSLNRDDQGSPT